MIAYAAHNRSAAIRIPYADRAEDKRVEVRFPDPAANPYLAFTAILMAGLDGIEHKLEPGDAMDRNLYDLRPDECSYRLFGVAAHVRMDQELTSRRPLVREVVDSLAPGAAEEWDPREYPFDFVVVGSDPWPTP